MAGEKSFRQVERCVRQGANVVPLVRQFVADVLTRFNVKQEHQRFITPAVNGEAQRLSCELQNQDDLTLFLPVGGG